MSPLLSHPGPANSITGDGDFVGANAPLRPLAHVAAAACANAFLDAGYDLARVTCSAVSTRPGAKHQVRAAIRPIERRAVTVVLEIDGWPKGEDTFGPMEQAGMERRILHLCERVGVKPPEARHPAARSIR
jgi:hypothetical protein